MSKNEMNFGMAWVCNYTLHINEHNMNTSGIEHPEIFEEFVGKEAKLEELDQMFHLSEWYPIVIGQIPTPTSFIYNVEDLFNGVIDNKIAQMQNQACFARLNSLSAKPTKPYKSSQAIHNDFMRSDRTKEMYKLRKQKVVLREWTHNIEDEFRCFIIEGKLRGISVENKERMTPKIMAQLNKYIAIISREYDDFTLDFGFVLGQLLMIEINSPVYLFASSGNFDLTNPFDYEVLLGEYNEDMIYPIIL